MRIQQVDLNCDLGEGCDFDEALMPLITSANVACGFHAGDPLTAARTLTSAAAYGVVIGAHPGFADKEHFGRRELQRSEEEVFHDCLYQIGALMGLARAAGVGVRYIKPHGALYNMACRSDDYARPIVRAAELLDLPLLGLPHSCIESLSAGRCRFIAEGFADRRYLPDGALTPRTSPNAFINDTDEALRQVQWLIRDRGVETICIHGDNPQALAFVRRLRTGLENRDIVIKPFV